MRKAPAEHQNINVYRGLAAVGVLLSAPAMTQAPAQAQEAPSLDERIVVEGTASNFVPVEASTAVKSALPLIDTPAAITVIESGLIRSQSAVDLQDILRNASGLNQAGNNYGIGDFLSIRGLPADFAYDGQYGGAGLGPDGYAPTRSLTNVERVEVLKGPSATLYGAGSAGGLINLIEKKPQFSSAYQVEARAGEYGTYGLTADATGPINDRVAYRLVGSAYSSDGFRDLSEERYELYGTLLTEVGKDSTLTASVAWITDEIQVDSAGYPVRIYNAASTSPTGVSAGQAGPGNLPNDPNSNLQLTPAQIGQLTDSLSAGDGLEPYDLDGASLISPLARPNDGKELRVKLRWDWAPTENVTVSPYVQYRSYDSNYVRQTGAYNYVYWQRSGVVNQPPRAPLVVDDTLYPFAARRQEYRLFDVSEDSWEGFLDVNWNVTVADMRHEVLVTGYYETADIDVYRASLYDADNARSSDNPIPYILDIRDPNWPIGSFEDYDFFVSTNYDKTVSSTGFGVQDVVHFTDWLIGRTGFGWNEVKQDFDNGPTETQPDRLPVDQTDSGSVFNVGLTAKPFDWMSVFTSYGEGRTSFSFAGSLSGTNDRPDTTSKNFEIGLKVQSPDQKISGGVTYFDTSRTNLRYNNPLFEDNPNDPNFNIMVEEFLFDGEDASEGVELDVNAIVTDGFYINANATWQDARDRRNPTGSTFDVKQKGVPDFFASVWGVYEVPTPVLGGTVRLALGYEYQDDRTINSGAFGLPDATLPSQGVWDASVEFLSAENWQAKLNIKNLTNELAYDRAMFLGGQPTRPRAVELVLRADF